MDNFESKKNELLKSVEKLKKEIEEAQEQLSILESSNEEETVKQRSLRERILPSTISRKQQLLSVEENQLEFMRPNTPEDSAYRDKVSKTFDKDVCDNIPDNLHLLFHGTSISAARDIIENGGIFSPAERGVESDITSPGKIWVTSKESACGITATIDCAKLGDRISCMPAGCIFVLQATREEESSCGKSLITDSISFAENPEKLFSIITTPENYERVQEWCRKGNVISPDKVQDFEGFIQTLKDRQNDRKQDVSDSVIKSAIEATEDSTRAGVILSQAETIQQFENEKGINKEEQDKVEEKI